MASPFCCTKIASKSFSNYRFLNFQPSFRAKAFKTNCKLENPTESSSSTKDSEPENLLLKAAWYGSELLGIAASYVRSPKNVEETPELALDDGSGVIDRAAVVESIKGDFQRSYFVTGFFAGALFSDVLLSVLLFVLIFLCVPLQETWPSMLMKKTVNLQIQQVLSEVCADSRGTALILGPFSRSQI